MAVPPSTVRNLQLWKKHCRQVRALAQRIVDGKVGVIEGSRQMLTYQQWLHAWEDQEFKIFGVADSETHHLPIGKVRDHWSPNALREKDKEIRLVEDRYRNGVIEAAIQIQKKYL
jgi:hypothetical protein